MRRTQAFTYVEVMLVASIIAILAAIAVPNFLEARTRALVGRSRAELAVVRMGLEAYRLETRAYPVNHEAGRPDGWDLRTLTTPVVYLSSLIMDPMTLADARGRQLATPPAPFQYYNGLQIRPDDGLLAGGVRSGEMGGFMAGMLWGHGTMNAGEPGMPGQGSYFTLADPTGQVTVRSYDPSNGTTSPGDIYQPFP